MTRPVFSFPICALTGVLMMWASALVAQPVLTSSDLPQGGQTYLRATAVPPLFSDGLEDSGAGLTWDYSDLISTGDQETEYFPMSEAGFTTQFIFSSADHFTAFELPDLGLETGIPISGATDLTKENMQALVAGLKDAPKGPVMIHCASGNRAGALLALKAAWVDGKKLEDAVALGKKAGLTRLEEALRALLKGAKK